MKICRECKRKLPPEEFYVHSQMADGRLNKCKDCVKSRISKHRKDNLDKIQAYDRSRSDLPHRVAARKRITENLPPEKRREYNLRHYERHPEKRAAHIAFSNAVRDGKVLPSDVCENCGDKGQIEAHHDDYSKPLDVRWLCAPCHRTHHKAERELKRQGIAA